MKRLLLPIFLLLINSVVLGSIIQISPTDSAATAQGKLDTMRDADIAIVPSGTINMNGSLVLRAGTLTSSPLMSGTFNFSTGNSFAIEEQGTARIVGIGVNNNSGCILGNYVTDCALKFDGSGNNAVGVRSKGGEIHLDRIYFHNSEHALRDADCWGITGNSSYSGNESYDTAYGPHLIIADGTLTINKYTVAKNGQMGIEVQDFEIVHGKGAVIFNDFVMYDFRPGNTNRFGYSFGTQFTGSLKVSNGYVAAGDFDANGKYFESPSILSPRLGYDGEHGGFKECTVKAVTYIGSWLQNTIMTSNGTMDGVKHYGWHQLETWASDPFGTEGGNWSHGVWVSITNSDGHLPISQAPLPPRRISGHPWTSTDTIPPVNPFTFSVSNPTAHGCDVSFSGVKTGDRLSVTFTSSDNKYILGTVTLPPEKTAATVGNLPNNWKMSARPAVGSTAGTVVLFQTPKVGSGDWPTYPSPPKIIEIVHDYNWTIQVRDGVPTLIPPTTQPVVPNYDVDMPVHDGIVKPVAPTTRKAA